MHKEHRMLLLCTAFQLTQSGTCVSIYVYEGDIAIQIYTHDELCKLD